MTCWEKALKSQQLEHALKMKLSKDNLKELSEACENIVKESAIG
jgi:hypothetical protein